MKFRSTNDIWNQCTKKDLLYSTGQFLLFFSLTATIWRLSQLTWTESFNLVMISTLSLFLIVLATRWRSQKKMRGKLLLDAGQFAKRGIYRVFAAVLLIVAGIGIIAMFFEGRGTLQSLYFISLFVIVSTLLLMKSAGRAEFCENGIWAYTALIPWSAIEAYQWKPSDEWKQSALWINSKHTRFPSAFYLDIPDNEKANVESLLDQHALEAIALHKQLLKPIESHSSLRR